MSDKIYNHKQTRIILQLLTRVGSSQSDSVSQVHSIVHIPSSKSNPIFFGSAENTKAKHRNTVSILIYYTVVTNIKSSNDFLQT